MPLPPSYDADELGRAALRARHLDGELSTAHRLGLTTAALRHLQSLVAERGRRAWEVGDALVALYGPPSPPGVMDGSRLVLGQLADELGCSTSWLVATRITAAAWPRKERRSCAWPVHRRLSANPDRFVVLGDFIAHCRDGGATPSAHRLSDWLGEPPRDDRHEAPQLVAETAATAESAELDPDPTPDDEPGDTPLRPVSRSPGRPRLDPVVRVERAALRLDPESLLRLIERLTERLAALTEPVLATA